MDRFENTTIHNRISFVRFPTTKIPESIPEIDVYFYVPRNAMVVNKSAQNNSSIMKRDFDHNTMMVLNTEANWLNSNASKSFIYASLVILSLFVAIFFLHRKHRTGHFNLLEAYKSDIIYSI